MNNEQAKFILQAYRPGGRDAGDAAFCEALQQARSDPILGAWFARTQAFYAAVASKLATLAPPAGLRESILAGARVSQTASPQWWRRFTPLAMAASAAFLLTTAGIFWSRETRAALGNLDAMARFALSDPVSAHGGHPHADKLGQFGGWLQNASTHLGSGAPVDFAQLKAQGCREVSVAGHPVLEVCFNRGGHWFHVYVARRGLLTPPWDRHAPVFQEDGSRVSVAWSDRRHLYVVVGDSGREALQQLL